LTFSFKYIIQIGVGFLLLFPAIVSGQQQFAEPEFKHLTIDNGLSHNTVYAILQDKEGFVWIGTRYGLNKFDGFEFKLFNAGKSANEIAGPTVLSLMEDRKGNIWIGHKDAGITILDKSTGLFKKLDLKDSNINWKTLTVRKIFQDNDGLIWIGTSGEGLICITEDGVLVAHYFKENNKLSSDFVFDITLDNTQRLWVACSGEGIHFIDKKTKTVQVLHSNDALKMNSYEKSIRLDKKGNLWIGTSGSGLYKYNIANKQFTHFSTAETGNNSLTNNRITDVETDSLDRIWIATDGGGISYFDLNANRFLNLKSSKRKFKSLNSNAIYQIYFDHLNNLWVGTFNGGVNIHSQNASPFVTNDAIYENEDLKSVLAIQEDDFGKIWLGTDGEGLLYIDPKANNKTVKAKVGAEFFPNHAVTCIKKAGTNSLWLGTFANGLSLYDFQKSTLVSYKANEYSANSIAHNNVWDIEVAPNGNLWIATLGGGLSNYIIKENRFVNYKPVKNKESSISSFQIIDVLLDANKKYVWVATEDKGLNRFDISKGVFKRYNESNNDSTKAISSNKIRCIYQDNNGFIWIGTEFNGINVLDTKTDKITQINTENGLSSNVIHAIEQDYLGYIWVATKNGLSRIDAKTFNVLDFGTDENLQNNQYNQKATYRLKNNNILFGCTGGYSIIKPFNEAISNSVQNVIFSDLKVNNQSIVIGLYNDRTILTKGLNEPKSTVELNYADKAIVFDFTSNGLCNLNKMKFAYFLEGFDKSWNVLKNGEHKAFFSSLLPGKYKLKVKVLDMNNTWSKESVIAIHVKPPFWKSWWFILLVIILIISLVALIFMYLIKRQKELFQIKANRDKQEILRLRNENLENEIQAKLTEQEILRLENEGLERHIVIEKRGQEILKLQNENLEREVKAKKNEKELLRLRNENLESEVFTKQSEQEILNLKNENLAKELEAKQTRLSVSLLQSAHKNQFLSDLKNNIQKIDPKSSNISLEIKKVMREINNEINQEDYWDQFQFNFDEMHKNFIDKLKNSHPQISSNDQRLCCFIRLDLNNREIASILNITVNGVEQTKYRLKKKMELDDKLPLNEYIRNI
jgi:ligand-binding sensor domain-containing protein